MVNAPTFAANLRISARIRSVAGLIIECGVWRGGMIAAIAALLGPERRYVLFDSFEGLPPARAIDGPSALAWQAGDPDNCRADVKWATDAMDESGARRVDIHPGWFAQTLPAFTPCAPIALLRLDADWHRGTTECLDALFDHVAPGGIVIVDDYYVWDGCARALHAFLARRGATERIRCDGDVAFLIKEAA